MAIYITNVPPEIDSQADQLSAAIEKILREDETDLNAIRLSLKNYGVRMFMIGYVNGIKRRN